ncbi:MAG: TIR domain-containing protein, partial [Clostridiales bacterium]|nr:TIR domain-containing protein [Clostridiales bacterium]
MAVIKCKMCGGDLEIKEGLTVAECEYCGSRQTIPTADNEKKLTLFGRAGRLLRGCEFDKAAGVFESIVADFPEEAEAYWGLVLCKYGIEYVDDPATGKKIPTCHRSSFDSVLDDENFEQACENADAVARSVYRAEARAIEELRKGIIQVSSREEPYDVFICYKETDDKGERTLDSVIAQDIYTALTEKGYRVFFSRISLEDKLGVEYEPYIFAALNSAKLMLAVGTDYEHFNAVWVKNEWSRFLALIASGQKKTLIPCYKNIDAYDMPREFAKLSAQDMGKVGAMQDLLRGVEKILGGRKEEKQAEPVTVSQPVSGGPNVRAMIDRGNMALEDGKWREAAEYFNRALDMDARCADAYLGQLLAKNQCADDRAFVEKRLAQYPPTDGDKIAACPEDTARINAAAQKYAVNSFLSQDEIKEKFQFDRCYYSTLSQFREQLKAEETYLSRENDFVRAERFASGPSAERVKKLKQELLSILESRISVAERRDNEAIDRVKEKYAAFLDEAEEQVKKRNEEALAEQAECEQKYQEACALQAAAVTQEEFENAEKAFSPLTFYKDANTRKTVCREKAHEFDLARDYQKACELQEAAVSAIDFNNAARAFDVLDGYLDSAEKRESCRASANKIIEIQREEQRRKRKKTITFASILTGIVVVVSLVFCFLLLPLLRYNNAEKLYASGDYAAAALSYAKAGNYKDAREKCFEAWEKSGVWSTISAGSNHTVGLKADGTAVAVGANVCGRCEVSGWRDIVAVSAGFEHTVGLKADGTVVAVGRNQEGQCEVSGWRDIVSVSAGYCHTVGLKADGTVVAVGDNEYGQCDVSDWRDIVAISASDVHTVGLKADGTVVAVGYNGDGRCEVSGWRDIVAISAGNRHTVGLKADGTVVAVGYNGYGQCDVSDWRDIVAISAGYYHTVGLKADGTVVAVGYNKY